MKLATNRRSTFLIVNLQTPRISQCVASPLRFRWLSSGTLLIASASALLLQHSSVSSSSTKPTCLSSSTTALYSSMAAYPELCVFDLDACFWDQEMYEMPSLPTKTVVGDLNGRGNGVVGVYSGPHKIALHAGSLQALQEHADGRLFPNMKVAFASSADTLHAEQIGRACLQRLEVLPGLSIWDVVVHRDWDGVDMNQIGRQPPLSSNKAASHFPRLKQLTGIRYDRMLFFDDCNWTDHCGMVAAGCRESDTNTGPTVVRTPNGLTKQLWTHGLQKYAEQYAYLTSSSTLSNNEKARRSSSSS